MGCFRIVWVDDFGQEHHDHVEYLMDARLSSLVPWPGRRWARIDELTASAEWKTIETPETSLWQALRVAA